MHFLGWTMDGHSTAVIKSFSYKHHIADSSATTTLLNSVYTQSFAHGIYYNCGFYSFRSIFSLPVVTTSLPSSTPSAIFTGEPSVDGSVDSSSLCHQINFIRFNVIFIGWRGELESNWFSWGRN